MAETPNQEPVSIIRKLLPFTTVVLIAATIYLGWFFFSRWQENRDAERKAAAEEAARARQTVEAYGGGQLKILSFTIAPPVIRRGEKTQVCYGVANAKSVKIEPKPDEDVWPSISRCVEVGASKDTSVTLTIDDGAGHSATQSLPLKVE